MSSTCAIMLVKDEQDIIEHTIRHLLTQVDRVIVSDNMSTDDTWEIIRQLRDEYGRAVTVRRDYEPGYYQSKKTTALAKEALHMGYRWVVPCDADEYWYSPHGRIGDVLAELPDHILFCRAALYNHVATSEDDPEVECPFDRQGWRIRQEGALAKVACRTSESLYIGMGNHDASTTGRVRSIGHHTIDDVLVIRHFPWRTRGQYINKVANGARAYQAAPNISDEFGQHWKEHGLPGDEGFEERAGGWFDTWGYSAEPRADKALIYDPATATNGEEQE